MTNKRRFRHQLVFYLQSPQADSSVMNDGVPSSGFFEQVPYFLVDTCDGYSLQTVLKSAEFVFVTQASKRFLNRFEF